MSQLETLQKAHALIDAVVDAARETSAQQIAGLTTEGVQAARKRERQARTALNAFLKENIK